MKIKLIIFVFVCMWFLSISNKAQVVQTSEGSIEFIGLEKWTPKMIQEKLGYDSADQLRYCAKDLKEKLKFPDVYVVSYSSDGYTVVSVVEPEREGDVKKKPQPTKEIKTTGDWVKLVQAVENDKNSAFGLLTNVSSQNVETPRPWWEILRPRKEIKEQKLALKTLRRDKNSQKRVAAAAILMNFPEENSTWYALMEGLRDADKRVNSACIFALKVLTQYHRRPINWSPSRKGIRAFLNGTNLHILSDSLKILIQTEVSPKLAKSLLGKGGGKMVLAYLKAQHDVERKLAHRFLVKISKKDFGEDLSGWNSWLNGFN